MPNPSGSIPPLSRPAPAAAEPTPRHRLLRALRGEPADRVPAWLMRQAGRYLPQYQRVRENYDFVALCKTPEAAAEVSIQPLDAIDSEAVIIFNDILIPLEQAGARVDFDDQGPLIHNPVRATDDLKRLQTRPVEPDEPVAQTIRLVRERVGEEIPILGFAGAPWTMATYWIEGRMGRQFTHTAALRFGDPALLDALLERIADVVIDYLRIQIEAGADAVQIFDTWGSILSQTEYARFSAPHLKRIVDAIRPLGAPVIVYVNGCAPYLDQLAALGADCLSIDWRTDLATARRIVGPGIALQGNLDPLALLAGPEATEAAVRRLFAAFPPAPGHVFNVGHGLVPQTPPASARALIRAVKEVGRYA
jgi:uroporphyrinogen decarboxylase